MTETVDPSLKGDFPELEVLKVLKIGLLCTQASVTERPSMVSVLRMLTEEIYDIPEPNQPPFLSTGSMSGSSTRSTYSINSSTSTPMMKVRTSFPSTDTSSVLSSDRQVRSEELRSKGSIV